MGQTNEDTYIMTTCVFVYFHPPRPKSVLDLPNATCVREGECAYMQLRLRKRLYAVTSTCVPLFICISLYLYTYNTFR